MRRRSAQVGALVLGLLRTLASALDSYTDEEDQEDVLAATSELVATFVELHVPRISQRPDFPVRGAAFDTNLNLAWSRRWRRRDAVVTIARESTRRARAQRHRDVYHTGLPVEDGLRRVVRLRAAEQ